MLYLFFFNLVYHLIQSRSNSNLNNVHIHLTISEKFDEKRLCKISPSEPNLCYENINIYLISSRHQFAHVNGDYSSQVNINHLFQGSVLPLGSIE